MVETVQCPCGSTKPPARVIAAVDGDTDEPFTYLVCPDCSLERLSPRPSADDIGAYYGTDYVPHSAAQHFGFADRVKRLVYRTYWAPEDEVPDHVRRWRPALRAVLWPVRHRSVLSFRQPELRRVFEFGAAQAADLETFKAAGWEVSGCEPSPQACAGAARRGIFLQNTTAEAAVLEDASFGCILFNNVFEHVHDPVAVLRKCHRALVPGGVLILIVPNHAGITGRLFGAAWPGYDAPRHTWGWTPRAVSLLLGRQGFTLDGIHQQTTGTWMWRSTLDMRHAPGRPGRVRTWLSRRAPHAMLPLSLLGQAAGHGDWMRVVARRLPGPAQDGEAETARLAA